MKTKILLTLFLCLFLAGFINAQSWVYNEDCIATAVSTITTGDNANMTDDFTAVPIRVQRLDHSSVVAITITFTGDGSMDGADVDFYFQASYDNGTTYTTDEFVIIDCPSDEDHSSNIVRHMELVNVYGLSHLRLWKVVNNDAANSITDVNATISGGK